MKTPAYKRPPHKPPAWLGCPAPSATTIEPASFSQLRTRPKGNKLHVWRSNGYWHIHGRESEDVFQTAMQKRKSK
ncbi:hypothetical protein, partial [Chromobacterium amazonense]|uniref:hypothetical protein n=1 Tax=Chromobacterium amazonense TaxID=1382803 RepID=UPI003F7A98CE